MSDLIKREDAIKAVEECLKLLARPRYTVKTAIESIPSVDIPHSDDWEKYSDKLWKNAYERGKADRPQGWIPCSVRLPSEKDYIGDVVIWCTDKSIVGVGWYYESTKSWATVDDTFPPILGEVIAWMPLPKPWKGADDEV